MRYLVEMGQLYTVTDFQYRKFLVKVSDGLDVPSALHQVGAKCKGGVSDVTELTAERATDDLQYLLRRRK